MELNKAEISIFLIDCLKGYVAENDLEIDEIHGNTRLIGANSFLDSIDLVRFIVELEESINEKYDLDMELMDEKAMSRRTSPFMNINTLSDYIIEYKYNE